MNPPVRFFPLLWALGALVLASCGGGGTGVVTFRVETVATGLVVPWTMAFLPDGRILVTERPGRVRIVENGTLKTVYTVPDVEASGESGLMGLTLHPAFATNKRLYISYAYQEDKVRVVRFTLANDDSLENRLVLIENIPAAQFHAGCQLGFGPDGKLYVTTGDATNGEIAQDLNSLGGKTLRLNDDGTIPTDNPFFGQAGKRAEVFSYGHRNAQGLDWQPGSGLMWQTEHGPSGFDGPGGGDEINIVEAGKNYGWPVIHHEQTQSGMESPVVQYTPAEAPAGAVFYDGDKFPAFVGNLFFACLRGEGVRRLVISGRSVTSQEKILTTFGRIRAVAVGPDGYLYFATSNRDGRGSPAATDDRILRIVPN